MMVGRVCLVICECPHGIYLVLYAAHDPLVGAHPWLGQDWCMYIWVGG